MSVSKMKKKEYIVDLVDDGSLIFKLNEAELTRIWGAEERPQGKWEHSINDNICSACGEHSLTHWKSKFCPNCGANMEVEE